MPYEAREGSNKGQVVNAGDIKVTDIKETYYCKTLGCKAEMSIINAGNIDEAHFRRKPSSPYHISASCVRCGIRFEASKYDESKFSKKGAFEWLFNKSTSTHKGETGTKHRKIGGSIMGFRSLGRIYDMCVSLGKMNYYNGELIDDLFADEENYAKWSADFNGCIIVECSFYKKVYGESVLLFNYSTDYSKPHIVLGIIFDDEDMCWTYYNKFKGCHHTEPIAIAGNWKVKIGHADYQAECMFHSSRQIYYVK